MTARNLLAYLIRQAARSQVTADLPGRVVKDSQRDRFEIVKLLPHFVMDAFTELPHIHAGFQKRDAYKRPFAIFILKGIMHARAHRCFDYHAPTGWLVYFTTIDRQMGVAIPA